MTSELLPVGMLTPVGSTLNVSDGVAGLMVTAPGIVAAISAPVITVALGRLDRRVVLVGLIGLVAVANLASAFAWHFGIVLAARLLVGVSVGGFWAIAGGLALRLVPQRHVSRAMAVIFGGVSTASAVGVPAGTLIGELSGWRTAFGVVGLLALISLLCLVFLVPALPSQRTITFPELPRLLRDNTGVRIGVIATFLLITGQFTAFTYAHPILREISGIDGGLIGVLLLTYGVAGVVGNFLAGSRAARHVGGTLLGISGTLAAAMALLAVAGTGELAAVVLMIMWGLAYGGVSVTLQTWILNAAPRATEAASSLFVSMFNLSIALGALAGGLVVDGLVTASVLWLATGLVVLTALAVGSTSQPRSPSRRDIKQ